MVILPEAGGGVPVRFTHWARAVVRTTNGANVMPRISTTSRSGTAALLAFAAAVGLAGPAAAADYKVGSLDVTQPWARATPKGASTGAAYMTVTNNGSAPERLSCASTAAAATCRIHEMAMNNGVMQMRPVQGGLEVEPGQTVTLKPGGYHMMLQGLKAPLKAGDKLEATLTSSGGGSVKVEFPIAAIGAPAPGVSSGGEGMKMQGPGMMPMHQQ
jgi:copper(I)-binding protein